MSVTDAQAHDLLELVRGHDVDRKISEFAAIKAQVKHQPSVQPEAINPLFDACRIAIASPNSSLAAQALSCLSHLTRRISLQEPARIRSQAPNVLPLLIEKLADQKERNKTLALSTIIAFYKHAPQEVEKCIKEQGFANKNPRVRQESIRWLSEIHKSYPNFSFKSYTPYLMSILEDSSEHVRDTAKEVVVELFSNAPDHAKSDLKRELQKRGVRKGIATYIVQRLGIPGGDAEPTTMSEDGRGHLDVPAAAPKAGAKSVGGSVAGSMASFISSVPGMELEQLEPVYVNTNRELEDIFDDMVGAFEGKESEHNWIKREQNVLKIRGLLRGNAYRDFQVTFLTKTKALLDGILKTVNSLRTTLSTTGCQLVKDLAIIAGPGLDPFVEIILVNMVKQCANTKKITSQLSNVVVVAIFANVSYHQKLLQHVHLACQDKNVQPRSYAAGWLTVILETHIDHKAQIEHSGGLDLIVKCVKRGLADANPGVRENMRATYWKIGAIWPDHANAILEGLDGSSRKLLEKTNPGVTIAAKGAAASARAPIGRAATAPPRPSVRDAILASKKSKSNLKSQFSSSDNDRAPSPVPTATPTLATSAPSTQSGSGLRAAPARRAPVQKPVTQARAASPALVPQSSRRSSTDRGTTPLSPPTMQRMGRATTPGRQQSPLAGSRKLTVLEQLNHADWKVRVEGIVVVACILAGRSPPNYDGSKMPSLPPNDVFAPTLAKLLNDPQPEVVEHLVAPEVLVRLTDFVPLEQIVPKVILLSEGDDEQHALPIRSKSLPMLKTLFSDVEFADTLLMVIDSMTSAGVNTKKISPVSLKTNEKRTIIHGCILWMNELVEKSASGVKNEVFHEKHNYKRLINRFIQMLSTTKAPTYSALATLLKNLQLLDPTTFSATLATFDRSIAKELHQAWGSTEDDDIIVPEEKVAHVAEVLGEVPAVGGTTSENAHAEDIAMTDAAPVAPPPLNTDIPNNVEIYNDPTTAINSNGAVATPSKHERTPATPVRTWSSKDNKVATPGLPKNPDDSARLLVSLIERVKNRDMDTQAFRKLNSLVRAHGVRTPLAETNGASGGDVRDIWQSGRVFSELLLTLCDYITTESNDPRQQGILVFKQLLSKCTPYFSGHEKDVLQMFISLKSPDDILLRYDIPELAEDYVLTIESPIKGIEAVLDILEGEVHEQGQELAWGCLAALVRHSSLEMLEPQLQRLGGMAIKSMEHSVSDIRKAAASLCIELHQKVNDDQRLLDDILKGGQATTYNLLAYYFATKEREWGIHERGTPLP